MLTIMITAEEKRLKSLEEKEKSLHHSVIKNASTSVDVKPQNKMFGEIGLVENSEQNPLFTELADVETADDFAMKKQFEGKNGPKLLELQTGCSNDTRFTVDSRFVIDVENNGVNPETEILALNFRSSLGRMPRFDPSKHSHSRFEKHEQLFSEFSEKPAKTMKEKAFIVENKMEVAVNETSTLKQLFQGKESFSLYNMIGTEDNEDDSGPDDNAIKISQEKKLESAGKPFRFYLSDSESEGSTKKNLNIEQPSAINNISGIWKETFFFTADDDRLKEGLDFMTNIQKQAIKAFSDTRRELKEIIRAKVGNNRRKVRPFKKKLRGRRMNFFKRN